MLYCTNRLVPNSAGWQHPPRGRLGSPHFQGYPHDKGFGHEDWNFNRTLCIGGFLYGYLHYEPAKSKQRERFNFAFLNFNGVDWEVTGFYLDAQFIPDGSPKSADVLRRKANDLGELALVNELGDEWRGNDQRQLESLLNEHRCWLRWRVRPENAILLQTPVRLPKEKAFAKAKRNHRFKLATDVGLDVFDQLLTLSNSMMLDEDDGDFGHEGCVNMRLHRVRERDPRLVKLAKARFLEKHNRLFCEVCTFDFGLTYGPDIGRGFIEAHHTVPVSQLPPEAKTRVEDLAMVCANCHRMLHRGDPWPTLDQLKSRVLKYRDQLTAT